MKKMKIAIASFLTLMSLQGFSSDNSSVLSGKTVMRFEKQADQLVYRLVYLSKAQGWVKVSIYDATGNLLLTDHIQNQNGFARPYNFRELPVGEYTIEVADGSEKITQHVFHGVSSVSQVAAEQRRKGEYGDQQQNNRFELMKAFHVVSMLRESYVQRIGTFAMGRGA